jgi:CubicO group peptidase (beta-lactamase class C family)
VRLKLLMVFVLAAACGHGRSAPPLPAPDAIDAFARELMAKEDVKGLAIAIIDGGEVAHQNAYGYANVEAQRPLGLDTVMYGASLTKTAVAYAALMRVEAGEFDLDRPLADYLEKPLPDYPDYADLKSDERWRRLTARHVLAHTTGFANFRWLEEDGVLRFHREPGSAYGYSGEGFYILQLALEEHFKTDLGADMQARLFAPLGLTRTSMQWRDDFAPDLADGYALDGSFEPHDARSSPSAAGSMDTTIRDQAKLWAAFARGDLLAKKSHEMLFAPQTAITTASQFPTLRATSDPRGPAIGLSSGLGLIVFNDPSGAMVMKGGHNDWTGNMAVCQLALQRCVIALGNSVRAELIYPELFKFILGETNTPWWWEYGEP